MLADARSLEALDFARVRERVARRRIPTPCRRTLARWRWTRCPIRRDRAPSSSSDRGDADARRARRLSRSRAIDTSPNSLESAQRWSRTPGGRAAARSPTRSRAAAPRTRDSRSRRRPGAARRRVGVSCAAGDRHRAITDAIDERGTVLDRASPALARVRRQSSRRKTTRAIASARCRVRPNTRGRSKTRSSPCANGRFVIPIKAEFAGEFPGHRARHERERADALRRAARDARDEQPRAGAAHARRARGRAHPRRAAARWSAREAGQIRTNVAIYVDLDLRSPARRSPSAMNAVAPVTRRASRTIDVHDGRHPLLDDRAVPQSITLDDDVRAC